MLSLLLAFTLAAAGDAESSTILGPSNPQLAEGSRALMQGDPERGVRLTHLGLSTATNNRDRLAGLGNLCGGYAMLGEWEKGLPFCDQAIELNDRYWRAYNNRALIFINLGRYEEAEADLRKGEELAPNSRTLKKVRAMLLEKTDPVSPNVIIDDRRVPGDPE